MKVFVVLVALAVGAIASPTRVIGGHNAAVGQFPYQISLQTNSHICGGSILTKTWVITAGHCIASNKLTVKAGLLHQHDTKDVQVIKVKKIYVHHGFDGGVGPNDIALLELSTPLHFNKLVQPINLPKEHQHFTGDVVLSGWGKTSNSIFAGVAETLQTVDMPVLTDEECAQSLIDLTGTYKPLVESNICTGPLSGGHSACNGDSGGPLVQDNTLVGIVSWGMVPCASKGAPAVFTEVSYFLDFIAKHIPELA